MSEYNGKYADLIPILGITEVAQMRLQHHLSAFFAAVGEYAAEQNYQEAKRRLAKSIAQRSKRSQER